MKISLTLNSKIILDKIFPITARGYNALAVDQYLDSIIADYRKVEENQLISNKEFEHLNNKVEELTKRNKELELENVKLSSRLGNISSSENVTSENMELLKKIAAYEKFIYDHNLDPKDAL